MYGMIYRHLWLPFFDGVLKGRKTLSHWRALEESQWWPRERLEEFQLHALRRLLDHAAGTCPYYHEMFREQGLNSGILQTLADLRKWPLLQRETILESRREMRSALPYRLISKSTGGSSGTPLHFDLDTGSNDRRTAQMYRGYGWAGGAPGTKQLHVWGAPLSTVAGWKRAKMRLHQWLDRKQILNCFDFTPENLKQHIETWNRYRPEVVVAYTNPLYEFARDLEGRGLIPFAPKSVIVGAEKLHAHQRETIERVFRTEVFETYGSREFMLIGAECEKHQGLHLSMENLFVEILDEDGYPTPHGEEGNVVITDLFNYGMPFIRYVNGDRAIAGWEQCSCGRGLPLLKKVTGRQLDILRTPDGRRVPGEFFPHLVKDYPAIRRFQVIQDQLDRIEIRLVAPEWNTELERRFLAEVREGVGEVVGIALQQVDDIPLTAMGKLKVVINRFAPEQIQPVGSER
jgi:phenylacetate-CoA ligase